MALYQKLHKDLLHAQLLSTRKNLSLFFHEVLSLLIKTPAIAMRIPELCVKSQSKIPTIK